jgi:uncharacterized membrane protein YccC
MLHQYVKSGVMLPSVRAATRVERARPAWAAGLRAAVVTTVPLLVAAALGQAWAGSWVALAGFNGALADRGGPRRVRALSVLAIAFGGAVAVAAGTAVSTHAIAAVAVSFLWALGCSLARVWGSAGATVGSIVLCAYLIALGSPAPVAMAPVRALLVAGGGLWALAVALGTRPLRPYRFVRVAVARSFRELARLAHEATERTEGGRPPSPRLDEALVAARDAVASSRRGRSGESGRGERLRMLLEAAEQIAAQLPTLVATLHTWTEASREPEAVAAARGILLAMANTFEALAMAVTMESLAPRPPRAWTSGRFAPFEPREALDHVVMLTDLIGDYTDFCIDTAASLHGGAELRGIGPVGRVACDEQAPRILSVLRASLTPGSVVFRFAGRLAVLTALATAVTYLWSLERAYWMTVTAVVVLQPYTGATTTKAIQRALGTLGGALLAVAIGTALHGTSLYFLCAFILIAVCVTLMPLSYAVYSVFLTPAFVLLAETGLDTWHLPYVRVINTLLGAALALVGSRLLWPGREWRRAPEYVAGGLRANRDYLRHVAGPLRGHPEDIAALRFAWRNVELATRNADESLQRLQGERGADEGTVLPFMTLVGCTRRFATCVGGLAVHLPGIPVEARGAAQRWVDSAEARLETLAQAILTGQPPSVWPGWEDLAAWVHEVPEPSRAWMLRLRRELETMRHAVVALGAAPPGGPPTP